MVPSISYQEDSEFLSLCVVSDNHMRIKKLHIKDVTRLRLKPLSYQFTPVPLDARPLLYCHQCNAKQLQRQTMQRAFKGLGTIQNGVQETECTVHYIDNYNKREDQKSKPQIERLEYTFCSQFSATYPLLLIFSLGLVVHLYLNPTLHGLKNVAGDTGGGHYGHPLENDPRGHFCGQIDL